MVLNRFEACKQCKVALRRAFVRKDKRDGGLLELTGVANQALNKFGGGRVCLSSSSIKMTCECMREHIVEMRIE